MFKNPNIFNEANTVFKNIIFSFTLRLDNLVQLIRWIYDFKGERNFLQILE